MTTEAKNKRLLEFKKILEKIRLTRIKNLKQVNKVLGVKKYDVNEA